MLISLDKFFTVIYCSLYYLQFSQTSLVSYESQTTELGSQFAEYD